MRFARTAIQGYPGAYAILGDVKLVDTAVVFVHGFSGDSVTTWLQFQVLSRQVEGKYPWWRNCDLYFWNYPSTHTRSLLGALDLRRFIEAVYPQPSPGLLSCGFTALSSILKLSYSSIDLAVRRRYKNLLLVGHSQGSILLRQAIMIAHNERLVAAATAGSSGTTVSHKEAILDAQLRLFAPALFGASLSGLFGFLQSFFLTSLIVDPLLRSRAGFNDLQPSNLVLQQLREQTETAANNNKQTSAFRAKILFGRRDSIVHPGIYSVDTIEECEEDRDHWKVCKPTRRYDQPLRFVRHERSGNEPVH